MTARESHCASITEVSKNERIVDYSFEKNEKSNVLAIHPKRPLIAYLINIQRTPKLNSKAWSGNDSLMQSPASSLVNGQGGSNISPDKTKTVSIRIIDCATRQRCLAKGIYHARPAQCDFAINSPTCDQQDIIKMAVVDRQANVYLYDLSYHINELTATRIAVIRSPCQLSLDPFDTINLAWCPFVPCEDFDDGDGGLRLALSTNSNIEIFAIDRLQGRTGELQRSDLGGAYKFMQKKDESSIVSLSISPDCSTISAAGADNRVAFFSSDIDDGGSRCLHKWEATMADGIISKLFFLDDYPKLLEDSTTKFWGSAFIGTRAGQMLLIDLRTWTVYQKMNLQPEDLLVTKNFDYRIDLTSKNIIAINGNRCYVIQLVHDCNSSSNDAVANRVSTNDLASSHNDGNNELFRYLMSGKPAPKQAESLRPKKKSGSSAPIMSKIHNALPGIVKVTKLSLHNPVYSFVIKHKSNDELELYTISAYSLELYIINLNALELLNKPREPVIEEPPPSRAAGHSRHQHASNLKHTPAGITVGIKQVIASASGTTPTTILSRSTGNNVTNNNNTVNNQETTDQAQISVNVNQMDKLVEALFTRLNMSFSQGLDEFLSEVRCEVNDLKSKLMELGRDVNRLQQQVQDLRLD